MNRSDPSPATVVVTGAASGIGAATAARLASDGLHVVVVDRRREPAEAVARELRASGGSAEFNGCDVADPAAVQNLFDHLHDGGHEVVGLVNNAGVGNLKPLEDYSPEEVDLVWSVNVAGTYNCLRSAAPMLRSSGGAVVNVASVSAVHPTRGEAPYSAAKAAVVALTEAAALEWAPEVRVNCVSPGFIRTPLNEILASNDQWRTSIEGRTPARRLGTAEETAELITFLLCGATYVTGQNVVIDGGSTLTNAQMDPLLEQLLGVSDPSRDDTADS